MDRQRAHTTPKQCIVAEGSLSAAMNELPTTAIDQNEDRIVIDRQRWKELSNNENIENIANDARVVDSVYWQRQFVRLKELRETEPERELAEWKKCSKEREEALTRKIALLEEKLCLLSPGQSCIADSTSYPLQQLAATSELQERIAAQQVLLQWYELLTCMKLRLVAQQETDNVENNHENVLCTAINRQERRLTQFIISGNDETAEIIHTPEANVDELPTFLQEEVSFHVSQAPMYISAILNSLHHNHEERSS